MLLIAGALGVTLTPAEPGAASGRCRQLAAKRGATLSFRLPPGGVVMTSGKATGPVELRRFASETGVPLAGLAPDQPTALTIPPDEAPDPWRVSVPVASLEVCTAA